MEGKTIETSGVRRWEDLNTDCVAKIFEKVGLQSLIFDVSFVCKSWYKASLDPLIYKVLHFELITVEKRTTWARIKVSRENRYSKLPASTEFIKIAVKRSCGMATEVVFPEFPDLHVETFFNVSALEYVLQRCPALKSLTVPCFNLSVEEITTSKCLIGMISKLKHLQCFGSLTTNHLSSETFKQIHIHCQNLQSLTVWGVVSNKITSDIVTLFPNIKHLVLTKCVIYPDNLIRILSGCRKLELLDVTYCRGFDGNDAMILKLASHINIFKSEGSVLWWMPERNWDDPNWDDPEDYGPDGLELDGGMVM